jgi:YNFM family putative membrane transporter
MAGFLFGATAMFAAMYETQAILPTIGRAFDVTPSQSGLTVSLVIISVAVAAWVWGPVSDRIGRRRSLVLSSAMLAVPTLAAAFAPDFGTFLACRILQGLCMPGLLIVGVPYVIETYAPRYGGRVMGYYIFSLVAGGLIGRVGVAAITSALGWRWALGLMAVLPVLASIVLRRTLPPEEAPARSASAGFAKVVALFRNPKLMSAAITGCGGFFSFITVYTYASYKLEAPPFRLDATQTGLVFAIWVLGILAPMAGQRAERHGWRRVAAFAMVLGTTGVLLTLTHALPLVILGLAMVMVAAFTGQTAAALGQGTSTTTDKGLASALYFSLYFTAGAAAGYFPGLAWEAYGWGGVAVTAFGSYGTGLAAVVGGALVLRRMAARSAAAAGERTEARYR